MRNYIILVVEIVNADVETGDILKIVLADREVNGDVLDIRTDVNGGLDLIPILVLLMVDVNLYMIGNRRLIL